MEYFRTLWQNTFGNNMAPIKAVVVLTGSANVTGVISFVQDGSGVSRLSLCFAFFCFVLFCFAVGFRRQV